MLTCMSKHIKQRAVQSRELSGVTPAVSLLEGSAPSWDQPESRCSIRDCMISIWLRNGHSENKSKKIWQFWIFFNELNICMFVWSALESFPTTSHLLSRFFPSFLFPFTFSLFPPVLTLLTEGQSYCGVNFSFGCFCLHASLVGQSKNLVKGTFLLLTTGCRGEWMNKCGRWAVGKKKKEKL